VRNDVRTVKSAKKLQESPLGFREASFCTVSLTSFLLQTAFGSLERRLKFRCVGQAAIERSIARSTGNPALVDLKGERENFF
jgi:hypothetical protein